jgi:peptidoglycan/LPS O-acetylase OafA/YrhL
VALVAIVVACRVDHTAHPAVWGLVVVSSAVVVGHIALADRSVMTRVLSAKPLVWVGQRSYGIYLYHFPIVIGTLTSVSWMADAPGPLQTVLFLCVTLAVAALSYRFIELPAQRFKLAKRKPVSPSHQHEGPVLVPTAVDARRLELAGSVAGER